MNASINLSDPNKKTTVGTIDDEILAFTAGKDLVLDLQLAEESLKYLSK